MAAHHQAMGILPAGIVLQQALGMGQARGVNTGCTLLLSVNVPGGLFSAGDCHAVQGNGEVCLTGVECPMSFSPRFNVRRGAHLPSPQFIVKRSPVSVHDTATGYFATTGVGAPHHRAKLSRMLAVIRCTAALAT
jgi:acetamidase/formamidase